MQELRTWQQLTALIGQSERADLDFKKDLDHGKPSLEFELASDIAALANTVGGHIVVGVDTNASGTKCTGITKGIDATRLKNLLEKLETAAKRCRPSPVVASNSIEMPGSSAVVLVLRVEASAYAPVGALVGKQLNVKHVENAWVFPHRVGSHTSFLSPDQFGRYESMSARRAAAQLDAIPDSLRGSVRLAWTADHSFPKDEVASLQSVDLESNVAVFEIKRSRVAIPLDDIASVWAEQQTWTVACRGVVRPPAAERKNWHYRHSQMRP